MMQQQVPVNFYRGGLAGAPEPIRAAYASDPRVEVANALLQQGADTSPVHGWGEGVVRALAAALGGYWKGEANRQYQDRVKAYNDTIGGAVGSGDMDSVAKALAGNPDTAQLGLELRLRQMDEQAANAGKQVRTLTPQEAQQMGLDPAGVYQVDGFGNINAVQKPDKPQIKEIRRGGQIVSVMVDGNGNIVKELGSGPAWKPGPDTVVQAPKTVDERDDLILRTGDPSSPEYAQAYYRQYMNPRFVPGQGANGEQTVTPIMPAVPPGIRPPTGMALGPQAGAGGAPGGAAPDLKAQAAADGAIYQGPDGTPQYEDGTPFDPSKPRKAQPAGQPAALGSRAGGGPTVGQPIVTGTASGKPPTADQAAAAGFSERMVAAEGVLNKMAASGTDSSSFWGNLKASVWGGNYLQTPEYQQYMQAAEDWVRAKLRKESGAVIGKDEMADEVRTYFPQPGDGPEVIEQKKRARATALDAMRRQAGGAGGQSAAAPQAGGKGGPASPKTQAEFDALPPGSLYHDPADPPGVVRRKP